MNKELNFEETMKQLEILANELEKGDLPLDKSVAKFEEGMKLSQACVEMLEEAEKKISILFIYVVAEICFMSTLLFSSLRRLLKILSESWASFTAEPFMWRRIPTPVWLLKRYHPGRTEHAQRIKTTNCSLSVR
mgnify:CR=1 FL=1